MRLATIRTGAGHRAVRVDADSAVETGDADLRTLLDHPDWMARGADATGRRHALSELDYAPLIPAPEKIICVGLNYRDHILETGKAQPEYPELFAKFAPTLIGAFDDVHLPTVSTKPDFEAELAVIIGKPVRHSTKEQAAAAIAGFTIMNDVSMRDFQRRTTQFLQGKMFDHTSPLGPVLVTPDELPDGGLAISSRLDDEVMQSSTTDQLLFGPIELICYISTIIRLSPGDVISTGTPGGVGAARQPPRWLTHGARLVTSIEGIGECRNMCRADGLTPATHSRSAS